MCVSHKERKAFDISKITSGDDKERILKQNFTDRWPVFSTSTSRSDDRLKKLGHITEENFYLVSILSIAKSMVIRNRKGLQVIKGRS